MYLYMTLNIYLADSWIRKKKYFTYFISTCTVVTFSFSNAYLA